MFGEPFTIGQLKDWFGAQMAENLVPRRRKTKPRPKATFRAR